MSNNKKSILIYKEWSELLKELSDKEYRQFFELIFNLDENKSPIIDSPIVRTIFNFISKKIIENDKQYQLIVDRNRVNGANGGRPKNPEKPKKPSGLFGNPKNPEKPRETLKDKDKDKDKDKVEEEVKDWDKVEDLKKESISPKALLPKKEKPSGSKSETVVSSTQKISADFRTLSDDHQKLTVEKYSAIRKTGITHQQILEWLQNFDEFWQSYTPIRNTQGRCVGKGDKIGCRISYLRILWRKGSHQSIMEGLKSYLQFCQRSDQLTLAASTFLNQERWKEDYSEFVNAEVAPKLNKAQEKLYDALGAVDNWEAMYTEAEEACKLGEES